MTIAERLGQVRKRMEQAAFRAGRDPKDVLLVAVSKTIPIPAIRQAIEAGVEVLGENRVQEARDKIAALGGLARWHLVGHLQTNKAKLAVQLFDLIHSLDSLRLAQELHKHAQAQGKSVECLIEVNLGGEETKSGLAEDGAPDLLAATRGLPALRVTGLMAIPPLLPDPEEVRPYFRRLRILRDRLRELPGGQALVHLSMGMTHDFEQAIEEGATMVRIGTAIFGPRPDG